MDLWHLPVAPTALYYDPKLDMEGSRKCTLTLFFEDNDFNSKELKLSFLGVEKFCFTYLTSLNSEMRGAYGKVILIYDSAFIEEIRYLNNNKNELNHYMITFDDGPCYEFICKEFIVQD